MGKKLERFMEHLGRELEGKAPERADAIRSSIDARRQKVRELAVTPPAPPAAEGVQP